MTKQEALKKLNGYIKSANNEPYDSDEETQGFISAMEIAVEIVNQIPDPQPQPIDNAEYPEDEKDAGGHWDLAAEIAVAIGLERGQGRHVVYAAEWGQERIYHILNDYFGRWKGLQPQPQPPQEPCEVCEILYEGYSIGNRKKRIYFKHCPECGRKLTEETK